MTSLRALSLAICLIGLAAVSIPQSQRAVAALQTYAKRLEDSSTLNIAGTMQVIGKAPNDMSLVLKKPGFLRFDTPDRQVIADGTSIYFLSRGKNTYYKLKQTRLSLLDLANNPEFVAFKAFFTSKAFAKSTPSFAGQKRRKGLLLDALEIALDAQANDIITLLFDHDKPGDLRQLEWTKHLPMLDRITVFEFANVSYSENLLDGAFTFVAPAGAKEVEPPKPPVAKPSPRGSGAGPRRGRGN